tara:strand:- start:4281 stop:5315 length:1035 start_codon:yes stop_codon:yes gene_type:complete
MSSDGLILNKELDFYPGIFAELNPYSNPVSTLLAQKGFKILPQKAYTYTTHSNAEASSADLKPDNASPTYGSSGFLTGSNTAQVFYKAAKESWAREGDQDLGRTLGWQGASNPSLEPSALARAKAEQIAGIKSELEYIGREGVYEGNTSIGTTTAWQQRGYRYAPGIQQAIADGAVDGAGDGTLGTLTFDVVNDGLESVWASRMWTNGRPLTCVTNSKGKKGLSALFTNKFDFGKNSESRVEAGVNIERFTTDFGNVDVVLAHNVPANTMYFLNLDEMQLVARPRPGKSIFFEQAIDSGEKASNAVGIYAELGIDHGVGSTHLRLRGVGDASDLGVGGETISAT